MKSIPVSGEKIPAVGLGTYDTFGVPPIPEMLAPLQDVLRLFYEAGGRVIDSSPMYGRSESVIGSLSKELGLAGDWFMATKVWTQGKKSGIDQMNASFEKLETDVIDLMQVHNLVDWQTHLETIREWKQQGRIRYTGITHYRADAFHDLEAAIRAEKMDFVQLNYSLAEPEADRRLLPFLQDQGVAVLVNRPFQAGSMFRKAKGKELPPWAADLGIGSWAQYFLKYIISHPAVTCAIPATGNPKHLADNMKAGYGPLPSEKDRVRMMEYWQSI